MRLTMATTSEGLATLAGSDGRNSFLCKHVDLFRLRLHCQSPGTRGATRVDALVVSASLVSVLELPKAAAAARRGSQPGQGGIRLARSHAESTSAFRGGLIVTAGGSCPRPAEGECSPLTGRDPRMCVLVLALRCALGQVTLDRHGAVTMLSGFAQQPKKTPRAGFVFRAIARPSTCPPIRRAA